VANALIKRVKDPAPPVRYFNSDLPITDEAEQILLTMLAKNPDDRPDSAMAVVAALDRALGFTKKY
jgi:hypothetical protein